jgi:hypothetical protein
MTAKKDEIAGVAVASDEQIEAYVLYTASGEIVSLRSLLDDRGARLQQLFSRLDIGTLRIPKVHPSEVSAELLETLGFHPAGAHRLYAARARSN